MFINCVLRYPLSMGDTHEVVLTLTVSLPLQCNPYITGGGQSGECISKDDHSMEEARVFLYWFNNSTYFGLLLETRIFGENPEKQYFSLILAFMRKKYFALLGKNHFFGS